MAKVNRDLVLAGFPPEVTWNDRKTVHTGWVRLGGLLHDAGLSPLVDEKLAIKVEASTRRYPRARVPVGYVDPLLGVAEDDWVSTR